MLATTLILVNPGHPSWRKSRVPEKNVQVAVSNG